MKRLARRSSAATLLLACALLALGAGHADAAGYSVIGPGQELLLTNFGSAAQASGIKPLLGDVTGDGKDDAVATIGGDWWVAPSIGSRFGAYTNWISGLAASPNQMLADVTGDGKLDAVTVTTSGRWDVARSTGSAFEMATAWHSGMGGVTKAQTGDVNGDEKADAVALVSGRWRVALSTGTSFGAARDWTLTPTAKSGTGSEAFIADVNHDDRADAVGIVNGGLWVGASNGVSFGTETQWGYGFSQSPAVNQVKTFVGDIDGHGIPEIVQADMTTGVWRLSSYVYSDPPSYTSPSGPWIGAMPNPNPAVTPKPFFGDIEGTGADRAVVMADGSWFRSSGQPVPDRINYFASIPNFGWTKPLYDDFNGQSLDTTKWSTQRSDPLLAGPPRTPYSNIEGASYESGQVTFTNTSLVQTIKKLSTAVNGYSYQTGSINSYGKFDFLYGYVEARIKVPKCEGCSPALWLLPSNGSWPPELDMFEFFPGIGGALPFSNSHWGTPQQDFQNSTTMNYLADFTGSFNTYGMLWTPDYVRFFLNGISGVKYTGDLVPHTPMYLIASLQQIRKWPDPVTGQPGPTDFNTPDGGKMEIDYIHVIQAPGP